MADLDRTGNTLILRGTMGSLDMEPIIEAGRRLIAETADVCVIDFTGATPEDSSFIGAVALLGTEALQEKRRLTVRAAGRAADFLSWAGLHRVVALEIASAANV